MKRITLIVNFFDLREHECYDYYDAFHII